MSRRTIAIATGAVIAFGAVAVIATRTLSPSAPAPVPKSAPASKPTAASSATAAAATGDEAPPPWAQAGDETAGAPAARGSYRTDPQRERHLQELQRSMHGLLAEATQRSDASNDYLRQALTTLEQMDDPAVKAQVNLQAVRHNLEISIRMQQLAQQLQQEFAQPRTPERQQRIEAITAQVRQLQSQLRQDVHPPGATVAAPGAR